MCVCHRDARSEQSTRKEQSTLSGKQIVTEVVVAEHVVAELFLVESFAVFLHANLHDGGPWFLAKLVVLPQEVWRGEETY